MQPEAHKAHHSCAVQSAGLLRHRSKVSLAIEVYGNDGDRKSGVATRWSWESCINPRSVIDWFQVFPSGSLGGAEETGRISLLGAATARDEP